MQRPHDTLEFTHEDLREAEERQFHKDITRAVQTQKITAEQGYRAVRKAGYTTTSYFGQDMGLSPKGSNVGGIPGFLGVDKEGHAHYETFGDWMRALGKTLAGEPLSDPNSASNLTDEERDYLGLEKNDTVLGPDRHDLSDREASKRGGQTGNDSPGGGGTVGGYDPGGYGDQSDGGGEFRGTGGYGGGGVGHSSEGDPAGFNPIVLDLDGDGFVELVDIDASTAFFDINGDGYRTHLGWAAADDGFLVYDKEEAGEDGFGVIRDADELSFVSYIDGAETDLEGLAHFDTNGDGRLNSGDDEWDKFRVWQDLDQDGETDDGELLTLGEWGIESVDLTSDGIEQDLGGNKVFGIGSYTLSEAAGGETRYLADVSLATSQIGFRTSADGSFEVQASDGSNIYEDSRFSNLDIDLGKLGYLGAFGFDGADRITSGQTGETLLDGGEGDDTLTGGGGNDWILGGAGADVLDGGEGHDILLIDADDLVAGSVLGGAGFDIAFVEGDAAVTLDVKAAGLEAVLGGGAADQLTSTYIAEDETDDLDIDVYLDGDDKLIGNGGDDTLNGGAGNDRLIGGEGDDTLEGGTGSDIASYTGSRSLYDILYDGETGHVTVSNTLSGNDGTDRLTGIEVLTFDQGTPNDNSDDITVDLTGSMLVATNSAVQTAKNGSATWTLAGSGGEGALTYSFEGTFINNTVGPYFGWHKTPHGYVAATDEDGGYEYHPEDGYEGADTFEFKVTDENGVSSKAKVNIGVGTEPAFEIANSVRLDSDNYLSWTPGGPSVSSWTLSTWVKWNPAESGSYATILDTKVAQQTGADFQLSLGDGTTPGKLVLHQSPANIFVTTAAFTDPNKWYHIVVAVDEAVSGSNKIKLYVDGDEITAFDTDNRSTASGLVVMGNHEHRFGDHRYDHASCEFDGAMANIHFVEGSQLEATAFGSDDGNVQNLVSAMAEFSPPLFGETELADAFQGDDLNTITSAIYRNGVAIRWMIIGPFGVGRPVARTSISKRLRHQTRRQGG